MSDGGAVIPHLSLTQRTADVLMEDILTGTVSDEDGYLQPVRLLAQKYGVSTLVIREALAHLQAQGVLERRQGRRTRVVKPDHTAITSVLRFSAKFQGLDLDELQACRAGLEMKAAELAATSDRTDKLAVLQPILDGMESAKSRAAFNRQDLNLHMAIAELSGNRPIQMILAALRDVIRETLDVTYSRVANSAGPGGIKTAFTIHKTIVGAVVKGDSAAASTAMAKHFDYFTREGTVAHRGGRR